MSATNCKCVERIEAQFKKNQKAELVMILEVDLLTMRTGSKIEWKLPLDRRARKTFLAHNYCPFCGEKGFDKIGLKMHLEWDCIEFVEMRHTPRPFFEPRKDSDHA